MVGNASKANIAYKGLFRNHVVSVATVIYHIFHVRLLNLPACYKTSRTEPAISEMLFLAYNIVQCVAFEPCFGTASSLDHTDLVILWFGPTGNA